MNKKLRKSIYNKTDGKCYYCGNALPKQWQVDHFFPKNKEHWLQSKPMMEEASAPKDLEDINDYRNLVPACPRCNKWKSVFYVEEFRNEIAEQVKRLIRYSSQFRMAMDFGLIDINECVEVKFYFERIKDKEVSA